MVWTEDRAVLQEVWAGRVPATFTLPGQDCPPCCLLLPRMSYLPLATEKVRPEIQCPKHTSLQASFCALDTMTD